MDGIAKSRRIGDGECVVLLIDADGDTLSLLAGGASSENDGHVNILASCTVALEKPWLPAALVVSSSSSIRLVGKKKDAKAQAKSNVMERVAADWSVRSLRTGIEYSTAQVEGLRVRVRRRRRGDVGCESGYSGWRKCGP